jgi:nucleoside-diphosphate-sugar epimerase
MPTRIAERLCRLCLCQPQGSGTGRVRREFLAVDDLADACIFVMKHYSGSKFLNIETGQEITIAEFAQLIADVVGYRGRLVFDSSRPDGAPQKLLNVAELRRLGWRAQTPLREGIAAAYAAEFSRKMQEQPRNSKGHEALGLRMLDSVVETVR